MVNENAKVKVQQFGRFLSNMVMPNIGAFIAWGLITALFIPTGWFPNETLVQLVDPMIKYLLPLLIGYTGGKIVAGDRGAVVGAITTLGVIVGVDIPMFLGAMIVGPLGGLAIKIFDDLVDGKVKAGFEMLVNNFSAGIIGMVCAIIAFYVVGPVVSVLAISLASGVAYLVEFNLLPLTSIFVEPAKILFLNNAINHGIFTPLGIQQAEEFGKSIFFLIEANPGPGLGILLAYMFFGKGIAKDSAPSAAIIHFFGGIHEIYFPYVLMKPRLLIAAILGGMTGVFILTLFNAGLVSPASPGSIFAVLLMTPQGSTLGVISSVVGSTLVSFFVAGLLLKTDKTDEDEDALENASKKSSSMKAASKMPSAKTIAGNIDFGQVKKIVVACDAGMGSSAMGATLLRKKITDAHLDINVVNKAINDLEGDTDIVISHRDLAKRAKNMLPDAHHISLDNFLDQNIYDSLVGQLKEQSYVVVTPKKTKSETPKAKSTKKKSVKLSEKDVVLAYEGTDKNETIQFIGNKMVELGYVEEGYVSGMLDREALVSTYLGESVAVPHGTEESRSFIKKTGIIFCQSPNGIQWGEDKGDLAKMIIGIAAQGDEHIEILSALTNALDDEKTVEQLITTLDKKVAIKILNAK